MEPTIRKRAAKATASALTAVALGSTSLALLSSAPAEAAAPEEYGGSARGDLLTLNASVLGVGSGLDASVGTAAVTADSSASTAVSSRASNLSLGAGGALPALADEVRVDAPPSGVRGGTLLPLDLSPLVSAGALRGTAQAYWRAGDACPPAIDGERVLGSSSVRLAGLTLADLPTASVPLASVGVSERDSHTAVEEGNSDRVASTATASGGAVNVLDHVGVRLSKPVMLRATGGPNASTSLTNSVVVVVTNDGDTVARLRVGSGKSTSVPIDLGGLHATVRVGAGTYTENRSSGGSSASLDALFTVRATVTEEATSAEVASLDLAAAGVSVEAHNPAAGVSCSDAGTADPDHDGLSNAAEDELGTDPYEADTDNDNLVDGDEVAIGTDPTRADTDSGGVNDGVEIAAGTDPLNGADDVTAPGPATDPDGDGLTTPDETVEGTDPQVADTDGDGLGDGMEVNHYSTDPLTKDTDGDSLADGSEVTRQAPFFVKTDPTVRDTDGDGLTDGQEVNGVKSKYTVRLHRGKDKNFHRLVRKSYSNPTRRDSDFDGIGDLKEIRGYRINTKVYTTRTPTGKKVRGHSFWVRTVHTNPLKKDTDGDGLTDGQELRGFHRGKHLWRSNPLNWDTDFGGVSDGVEARHRTNPLDIRNHR